VVRLVDDVDEEEDKIDVGVESDFVVGVGGRAFEDRVLNGDDWGLVFRVPREEAVEVSVFVPVGKR
jgi:hypothetical protein